MTKEEKEQVKKQMEEQDKDLEEEKNENQILNYMKCIIGMI